VPRATGFHAAGALPTLRRMTAPVDVHALAGELLQKATAESAGRAARTLPHPVDGLRQTLIALRDGAVMHEHESPGAASLMVIRGRVTLVAGDDGVEVGPHQIAPIPDRRHSLRAEEQSVVLLSVALPARSEDGEVGERRNVGG
jgi:quercetin dioxygenase-like cupin family protein